MQDVKKEDPGSEHAYQVNFNLFPQPMWIYQVEDKTVLNVNQAALDHYGYSRAEFLSMAGSCLHAPGTYPQPVSIRPGRHDQNYLYREGTYKHRKKSGEVVEMQIRASTIDIDGKKAELIILTDLTAVVAAETRFKSLSEKYRDTQNIAQLGYWCRNLDQDVSEWSEQMYVIYGRDQADFVPSTKNLAGCLHPDDRFIFGKDIFLWVPQGAHRDITYRIITDDNKIKWVFQRMQPQYDAAGRMTGIKGIIQDVSERIEAEHKFKAIFDNTTDAVVVGDDQGNCLDYNQAAMDLFGFSAKEFGKTGLNQLFKYPGEKQGSGIWKKLLHGKIINGSMLMQQKDGSHINVRFNARPAILPGMHLCIITDTTQQLKQERLLLSSERRFKALVHEGSDLIAIVDNEGKYKFLGDSCHQLLGKNIGQYVGRSAFNRIHPQDRMQVVRLFSKLKDQRQIRTDPFRVRAFDGSWRWLRTIATDMSEDADVAGIVINSRDITDAVLKTHTLARSNECYKLLTKAAGETIFDWDIEHDKIEWGNSFKDIFGYDLSESDSYLWYNNIHDDDRNRVWATIEAGMSNIGSEMIFSKCMFRKADGVFTPVKGKLILIRNQQGAVVRAVGSLKNMAAHIQMIGTAHHTGL